MAYSLPTEIIQLVVDEVSLDASTSVATILAVSSIAQHWRAVALSTPALWSTFSFCLRACQEAMLCAFFERSLPDPLCLTISLDFPKEAQIGTADVQHTITLVLRQAYRLERLHFRFFTRIHRRGDVLGQLLRFESPTLQFLEIESLDGDAMGRIHLIDDLQMPMSTHERPWSERCPALTHVRCTIPDLLTAGFHNMTHLCIKGVPGRRNVTDGLELQRVLEGTRALAELVIDGVSFASYEGPMFLPHLHTLYLRHSPQRDGTVSIEDTEETAYFLRSLTAPALASLTIDELNEDLPACLEDNDVCIPSVTRFALVSRSAYTLYTAALPGVEELVLLGSDPTLFGIEMLQSDGWPNIRIIDLTALEPPPLRYLRVFSESLSQYGDARREAGHASRVVVRLPRGILPEDLDLPSLSPFMDAIQTA